MFDRIPNTSLKTSHLSHFNVALTKKIYRITVTSIARKQIVKVEIEVSLKIFCEEMLIKIRLRNYENVEHNELVLYS